MKSHYSIASGCILLMFVSIGLLVLNIIQYNKAMEQYNKAEVKINSWDEYYLKEALSYQLNAIIESTDTYPELSVMLDSALEDGVLSNGEYDKISDKETELKNKSSLKKYFSGKE